MFSRAEQDRRPERDRGGNKHQTLEAMLIEINDETPIAMLTVGQLKEILSHSTPTEVHVQQCPQKHLVYGYDGLARLLKVSRVRAGQIIRGGQIADAVTQFGRSIVIDADKALELLGRKSGGRGR